MKKFFYFLLLISASAHSQTCEELILSSAVTASTISYYDSQAQQYNENNDRTSPEVERQRQIFMEHLPRGGRILEIGAGHGRDALFFKNQGFQILATDASPELAKIASQKLGEPVPVLLAQDVSFKEEFDGVWAMASLIHVPLNELKMVFEKLRDALKPGGVIHASFIQGVGTPDQGQLLEDGRFFSRATETTIRQIAASVDGLKVDETLTNSNRDDYHGANAPSKTFGFFNLYLVKDPK